MRIVDGVHRFADTCHVYVLVHDGEAVLIDFGSGQVLDHLADFGVDRVAAVLLTHHHRDQAQGLARAAAAGIPIWVPPVERDLFDRVDEHWQARAIDNNYDLRDDRFSLLEPVPVAGVAPEYRSRQFGGFTVTTVPTPGHTIGSVSYLVDVAGHRVAFTGDLIYGPGKVWSLAGTQWTYSGLEGVGASVLSLAALAERDVTLALPSHGAPITDPPAAFTLLSTRLEALLDSRPGSSWHMRGKWERPFEVLSPHLLRNRTSHSVSYALLSDSGTALLLDFGYDMAMGLPAADDRSSRRPLLASLTALRRDFGVERVEVAVPTHYHDDHVAGFNLLREVEGTEVWAEASVAAVISQPRRHNLPCLWYDPIPVDKTIAAGETVRWREYELTFYPLPGHTLYASAIAFTVDGRHVLATGDQQDGGWVAGEAAETLNFQYANRFRIDDYVASARLYQRLRPELMISGHWAPRAVDDAYLDMLLDKGEELARLHRDLLPLSDVDFGAEGVGLRMEPYRSEVAAGDRVEFSVEATNPFRDEQTAQVALVLPEGWRAEPAGRRIVIGGHQVASVTFQVTVPATASPARRRRVGADLTVGGRRFGQHAEALVDVS